MLNTCNNCENPYTVRKDNNGRYYTEDPKGYLCEICRDDENLKESDYRHDVKCMDCDQMVNILKKGRQQTRCPNCWIIFYDLRDLEMWRKNEKRQKERDKIKAEVDRVKNRPKPFGYRFWCWLLGE